eukprot:PhF_6_TR6115/c0_g1_i1/m.9029
MRLLLLLVSIWSSMYVYSASAPDKIQILTRYFVKFNPPGGEDPRIGFYASKLCDTAILWDHLKSSLDLGESVLSPDIKATQPYPYIKIAVLVMTQDEWSEILPNVPYAEGYLATPQTHCFKAPPGKCRDALTAFSLCDIDVNGTCVTHPDLAKFDVVFSVACDSHAGLIPMEAQYASLFLADQQATIESFLNNSTRLQWFTLSTIAHGIHVTYTRFNFTIRKIVSSNSALRRVIEYTMLTEWYRSLPDAVRDTELDFATVNAVVASLSGPQEAGWYLSLWDYNTLGMQGMGVRNRYWFECQIFSIVYRSRAKLSKAFVSQYRTIEANLSFTQKPCSTSEYMYTNQSNVSTGLLRAVMEYVCASFPFGQGYCNDKPTKWRTCRRGAKLTNVTNATSGVASLQCVCVAPLDCISGMCVHSNSTNSFTNAVESISLFDCKNQPLLLSACPGGTIQKGSVCTCPSDLRCVKGGCLSEVSSSYSSNIPTQQSQGLLTNTAGQRYSRDVVVMSLFLLVSLSFF